MNPNRCRLVLRPRTPFEVFDLTTMWMGEQVGTIARVTLWLGIGPALAVLLLCWFASGHPALAVLLLGIGVFSTPFTILGGQLLFHDGSDTRGLVREASRWLPIALFLALVDLLAVPVALFTCGYGMLVWIPGSLYLPECLLLERVGLARGIQRSMSLAGRRPGAAVIGTLARIGLTIWGALVGEAAMQLILQQGLQLGTPFGTLWTYDVTPGLLWGAFAIQPLVAFYRLLVYVDVRTRSEGWDIQVAFRALTLGDA